MAPKDFHEANRTGWVKAARVYSNAVSPPTMFGALGLAIALYERPSWEGFAWGAGYGFMVSLLPILFVLFLLYTGRIAELHMSNTKERFLPYVSAIVCSALMLGITLWWDGPSLLVGVLVFNLVELIALNLITMYWLISMHSTAAIATAIFVGLVWGLSWGLWIGVPLVVSVSFVRIYLQRHTVAQVLAGLVLGVLSVWVLVPLGLISL